MVKGVDVAKWNGMIDWGRVKAAGIEFAILKVINKQCREEDSFSRNYAGASAKGLSIGIYNYSYATSVEMAQNAARKVLQVLAGKKLQCRVWLDIEDKVQQGIGHKLIDIIKAYQKVIEDAGYEFGVYTGLYFYNTYLKPYAAELECKFWIARYPSGANVEVSYDPPASKKPAIRHALWGWQYSSTGSVPGITGNVDMDLYYGEVAVSYPVLRKESRSADVRILQEKLNSIGYHLATDGIFGSKTDEAVRAFQADHGLAVDGVVGVRTWAELNR